MKELPSVFVNFAQEFIKNGFKVFLVGGSSRDFLLDRYFKDYDVATNATPEQLANIFPNVDLTFAKYGSTRIKFDDVKFDVTTFRKENGYKDHRHPNNIIFTDSIQEDFFRRDFTINAIYIDSTHHIYDFSSGLMDLKYNLIRMIGNPSQRIIEDPLRILRAIRFSLVLDFEIEESLKFAMMKYSYLLNEINLDKIKQEVEKIKKTGISIVEIKKALNYYHIVLPSDVIGGFHYGWRGN